MVVVVVLDVTWQDLALCAGTCGRKGLPLSERRGVMMQANQCSGAPFRDERLDISSSGKSRSDPARMRARAGQRGRGRHSLDVGRDLKRSLTNPTIDENVRDSLLSAFEVA